MNTFGINGLAGKWSRFVGVLGLSVLLAAGCPLSGNLNDNSGGNGGNLPDDDPDAGTPPVQNLSAFIQIRSGSTRIQFPSAGQSGANNSATLFAVVSNAIGFSLDFNWTIQRSGGGPAIIAFRNGQNTSQQVIVDPTSDESADHNVSVTINVRDNGVVVATLTDTIVISVTPSTNVGECSSLATNPFTDPPVGVDPITNSVTLDARPCGTTGAIQVNWTPLVAIPDSVTADTDGDGVADTANLDPTITIDTSGQTLTLFVAESLTGVFPFLVTVTDESGDRAAAVVDVTLAIPDAAGLNIDVAASRIQGGAGSTVSLQTLRTGGVQDPTGPAVPDTFTYTWRVLDSSGAQVAASFLPASGVTNDNSIITWLVTGLSNDDSYRFEVTVSDPFGFSDTDSATVLLADVLSLDARSQNNVYIVPPAGTIPLIFDQTGGVGNYTYTFSNDGPGAAAGNFSVASGVSVAGDLTLNWTAPAAAAGVGGTYRIDAFVTDSLGNTATDSMWVIVQADAPLSLDVRSTTNSYIAAPGEVITLSFDRTGGVAPFSYAFTQDGPGASAGVFGSSSPQSNQADDITVTWTAPAASPAVAGTYRIDVTVTDALGFTFTDSVFFIVRAPTALSLDVRPNDTINDPFAVAPGETLSLRFDVTGGVANYSYAMGQDGPGGNAGTFGAPLNSAGGTVAGQAGDLVINWTAPAAAVGVIGTYRIQVVVTDALGDTFTDSLMVSVRPASTLSLDVRPNDTAGNPYVVGAGGTVNLRYDVTGGVPNYSYAMGQDGPAANVGTFGAPLNASGGTVSNQPGDLFINWTAPAASSTSGGSYRIQVVVTDAVGATFTDSVTIFVQSSTSLSLDVQAARLQLAPPQAGTRTEDQLLRTTRTGGTGAFSYVWTIIDSAGNDDTTDFTGPTIDAGSTLADVDINWDLGIPSTLTPDTYRFYCTVTDAFGETFTSSTEIRIFDSLSLDLRSTNNNYFVVPAGTQNLRFDVSGGISPFSYEIGQDGPGANTGTFGAPLNAASGTVAAQAGDLFIDWTAPAAAAGVAGSYRIQVIVRDSVGNSFTDSMVLFVQSAEPLSLDVRSNDYSLDSGAAETGTLTFDVTGGTGNYTFTYVLLDSAGATVPSQNSYFDPNSPQSNAGDLTVTLDPLGEDGAGGGNDLAAGSYTVVVTVTDALGSTFTDSVAITVQ